MGTMKPLTCWVKFDDEWEQCSLHAWSTDHEEYDTGPGHFPVGIVERGGGRPCASVCVESIHLEKPDEWKALRAINDKSDLPVCQVTGGGLMSPFCGHLDMMVHEWIETQMKDLEDDPDPNPKDRVHCHRYEPNNTCPVCGEETTDQYMVTKRCWAEAEFGFYDNAHLVCLQKRLGRPLVKADFVVAPINEGVELP